MNTRRLISLCTAGLATLAIAATAVPAAQAPLPGQTCGIGFASSRAGNAEIYTADANGQAVDRVTNVPAADLEPAFSPDGSRIAFVSLRNGTRDIYVMQANGTQVSQL